MRKTIILTGAAIAFYIAAYAAMLKPIEAIEGGMGRLARFNVPAYRAGSTWAVALFEPLNRLDQVVRTSYWAEREIPETDIVIDRIEEIPIPEPVDPNSPLSE